MSNAAVQEPLISDTSARLSYLNVGRSVWAGLLAGIPSGLLVGGIGSRLVMRIVALIGGDQIAGKATENGNTVGEVTAGGTIFLVLFAGVAVGIVCGLAYGFFRSWLPGRPLVKGLILGVLLLASFGAVVIDAGNKDFADLGSPGLSIAMFAALFLVLGVVSALAYEHVLPRLPPVRDGLKRRYRLPYAAAPAFVFFPLIGLPGLGLVAVILVAIGLAVWVDRWYRPLQRALGRSRRIRIGAQAAILGIPAVTGSIFLGTSIVEIMRQVDVVH